MKKAEAIVDISWVNKNDLLWVQLPDNDPTRECYKRAIAVEIKPVINKVLVRYEGSNDEAEIPGKLVFATNSYKGLTNGYDDMVEMENLSEAELLFNLRERYSNGRIFTYVGSSLIVINPYCAIPELFTQEILLNFQDAVRQLTFEPKSHMPHVYAISSAAITNLLRDQRNQAIVISGESGAGKTENTKFAMKFLTSLNSAGGENSTEPSIEDKILACNPILEAFGNAKTVRNDNSSRFGKYVSLLIEKGGNGKILGATLTNYLLEKSRCCTQSQGERNYHIYYHLFKGASMKELESLYLAKDGQPLMESLEYLNRSGCYVVPTVNDVELYNEVVSSFNTMKFTKEEQKAVWTLVACSLLLGNVDFDDSGLTDKIPCAVKNEEYLKAAIDLLQCDYAELSKALTIKFREVQGQVIESTISRADCITQRDSLAKELYNRLFNWLVKRLNFTVMPPEFLVEGANIPQLLTNYYHIGLLDIFGFEIFKVNSLEQLCINYTNEQLQQLYIYYIFKAEEKEFSAEGLQDYVTQLVFKDNQDVIDLLDKLPSGIFCLTDESCLVNSTDEALCQKILKSHEKNPCLTKAKLSKDTFIVQHTSSPVEYNINGFRFKNRDELSPYIEKALFKSTFTEIPRIYKGLCGNEPEPPIQEKKVGSTRDKFLGAKFRVQMRELYNELKSCDCHFIRCIKPNDKKEKKLFVPRMTLQQIQYMGILETIKVRKSSYPTRRLYKNFYEKYEELAGEYAAKSFLKHVELGSDFKEMSRAIVKNAYTDFGVGILFGNTRIFMKLQAEAELNKVLGEKIKFKQLAARRIQKLWFRYNWFVNKWLVVKKKVFTCLRGIRTIQNLFRVREIARKFQKTKSSTKRLQRWYKTVLQRRKFQKAQRVVRMIQAWWKMKFYSLRHKQLKASAKLINRVARGLLARKESRKLKFIQGIVDGILEKGAVIILKKVQDAAATRIQAAIRGFLVRSRHKEIVKQVKLVGLNMRLGKYAVICQRNIRGFIVRSKIARSNKAARVIQGKCRSIWLRETFLKIRAAVPVIQRCFRSSLAWKTQVKRRFETYNGNNRISFDELIGTEYGTLFGGIRLYKEQLALGKITIEEHEFEEEQGTLNRSKQLPSSLIKIPVFIRIIDLDVLGDLSEMYDSRWSVQAMEIQNQYFKNHEYDVQVYEVGGYHSLCMTNHPKLYSWGVNDKFQLGRPLNLKQFKYETEEVPLNMFLDDARPRVVKAGDDHNLLLDSQGRVHAWGANNKGQLGIGHTKDVGEVLQVDLGVHNDPVVGIRAKGMHNVAVTASGSAFVWPFLHESGWILSPYQLTLPKNIKITSASCGINFTILLASNGLLFSFGTDNSAGQLGLGDTQPRLYPTLVSKLKNDGELATQVSCGYKHVICRTSLGRAYVWGWGGSGQLGLKDTENQLQPTHSEIRSGAGKEKVLQVQAGYRSSLVLTENRKLFWTGTNGTLIGLNHFREINLADKIPGWTNNLDLQPVRVLCSWSKSLSVTYATFLDTRPAELNNTIKPKFASKITSKLEELGCLEDITLPYIDTLSKYFPGTIMKKPTVMQPTPKKRKEQETMQIRSPDKGPLSRNTSKSKGYKGFPLVGAGNQINYDGMQASEDQPSSGQQDELSSESFIRVTDHLYELTTEIKHETILNESQRKREKIGVLQEVQTKPVAGRVLGSPPTSMKLNKKPQSPMIRSPEKKVRESPQMARKATRESPQMARKASKDTTPQSSKRSSAGSQELEWSTKLRLLREKLEQLLLKPMEKWNEEEKKFFKIASEPELYNLLRNVKLS